MLKKQKGFTLVEGVVALGCLAILALAIGAVSMEYYVIMHFVRKFW
jgi:type II secretory pathway pseudopilin PulG